MRWFARVVAFLAFSCAMLAPVAADQLDFGFRPIPPYVIDQGNGTISGLEYEIITAALAVKGHTVKPVLFPLARLHETFKARKLQAAAPALPSSNLGGGVLSDSYITYNNTALALRKSGLDLKTISDLKGLSIIAFQTAKTALGPEFAAAVEGNPRYGETPQQVLQISQVFMERAQVAIGESRILNYFIKSPEAQGDKTLETVEFNLFPPTEYRVAFVTQKLATDFNEGLKAIKADGTYARLLEKYRAR